MPEKLIPKHGGFRNLVSYQIAEMIYDVTVRFCDMFINPRSRTHDQMVQAARSGAQNIAEGSMDSGTSKKIELKLTGVARGSLVELQLDYEAYLRHHELPKLAIHDPILERYRAKHCNNEQDVRLWVKEEMEKPNAAAQFIARTGTDRQRQSSGGENNAYNKKLHTSWLVANAALSMINLATMLLHRQLDAQAETFEKEGGFTERLYRVRSSRKNKPS